MESPSHPALNRIPGTIAVKEKYGIDLTKVTRAQLLEIKDRQINLLNNKQRAKLPDKGKRLQDYYDKIVAELENRDKVNEAAALFSKLNLAPKGKEALNKLEWKGQLPNDDDDDVDPSVDLLDSDDERELDPLRVIAQRTMHERRQEIILPPEVKNPLITAEDLEEIESFKNETPDSGLGQTSPIESGTTKGVVEAQFVDLVVKIEKVKQILEKPKALNSPAASRDNIGTKNSKDFIELDQHALYLIDKTEKNTEPQREKFKPYKSTISNVHDADKERVRKMGKHWEVTAATPPLIQRKPAQLLSLTDSVELQCNYLAKLKNLQEQQAKERLARKNERLQKLELPASASLNKSFKTYRTPRPIIAIEGSISIPDESEQIHDPLDSEGTKGTIRYSFTD